MTHDDIKMTLDDMKVALGWGRPGSTAPVRSRLLTFVDWPVKHVAGGGLLHAIIAHWGSLYTLATFTGLGGGWRYMFCLSLSHID